MVARRDRSIMTRIFIAAGVGAGLVFGLQVAAPPPAE
jgi:hypothetical protein